MQVGGRLQGQEEQCEQLIEVLLDAQGQPPQVVSVFGPPGAGEASESTQLLYSQLLTPHSRALSNT